MSARREGFLVRAAGFIPAQRVWLTRPSEDACGCLLDRRVIAIEEANR